MSKEPQPRRRLCLASWTVAATSLALAAAAMAGLFVSQANPDWLLDFTRQLEPERPVPRLDRATIATLQNRALALALFWSMCGGLVFALRRQARGMVVDALEVLADSWTRARQVMAADPWHTRSVLILTVVAALLAALYGQQTIRFDESLTFRAFGVRPVFAAMGYWQSPNNHILHSVFMRLCTMVLGPDLYAIRLPAMLGAVLMVPLTYCVGSRWFDRNVG